jgi:DNA polymerase V
MYLAKIAMDIKAKKLKADKHGVRIAELNEMSYRKELWDHQPLTDFWRIGRGYSRRLEKLGIHTMGDLARYSLTGSEKLYKEFGIAAELLIDHAWGYEPVTMADIKNYRSDNHSVSSGQVLHEPYEYESARLIAWEMADTLALDLFADGLATDQVVLTVNYDKDNPAYDGPTHIDFYGRTVPKPAHGTLTFDSFTNSSRVFAERTVELFDKIVNPALNVRAIYVVAGHVKIAKEAEKKLRQKSLFVDYEKEAEAASREQKLQAAEIAIKKRYGRNAIMKLKNFEKNATMRARNNQVGGHKA